MAYGNTCACTKNIAMPHIGGKLVISLIRELHPKITRPRTFGQCAHFKTNQNCRSKAYITHRKKESLWLALVACSVERKFLTGRRGHKTDSWRLFTLTIYRSVAVQNATIEAVYNNHKRQKQAKQEETTAISTGKAEN